LGVCRLADIGGKKAGVAQRASGSLPSGGVDIRGRNTRALGDIPPSEEGSTPLAAPVSIATLPSSRMRRS
jgi:hypothetical protein